MSDLPRDGKQTGQVAVPISSRELQKLQKTTLGERIE
jgi:hypothetical protein